MNNMEEQYEYFKKLHEDIKKNYKNILSEQDTRFQIIDRILVQILGWSYQEIKTESHNDTGFIDYLLVGEERSRAIVEAKKASNDLINIKSSNCKPLKILGPALKNANDGIKQAKRYCIEEGVDLGILTNGTTWIAFLATRSDGKKPEEGKAIAFPNLESIDNDFAKFWEIFSRESVVKKLYRTHINQAEGFSISPSEKLHHAIKEDSITLSNKPKISRDLEEAFDRFFSAISDDNDSEMLTHCFVESKESKGADKTMTKIASDILAQIQIFDSATGDELNTEISRAVEFHTGEKVLIIGNKGSGKSTFIDRFFKSSLEANLRKQCVELKIDLAKFTGEESNLINWLNETLKSQIDKKLYNGSYPSFDELKGGVFFSEYNSWKHGSHKHLYEKDRKELLIEFGKHIQSIIDNDPYKYCKYQLINIVRSRKKLPCIIFDNTDQYPLKIQQSVFQYANAFYEAVKPIFLIIPITDKTIWQMSKSGPLQSYKAKSFYLPTPSTKTILEKRIEYVSNKIEEKKISGEEYLSEKGFKIEIKDITAFAACLEEIFLNNDYIARRIGCLANYDIRRSLELSRRLITSPHLKIDDLITAYFSEVEINIPKTKVITGLINGLYDFFRQDQSSFIFNIFSINPDFINSPLLKARILKLLQDKDHSDDINHILESYLTCNEIEEYFDPIGVPANIVLSAIEELLSYRLIEPYDPTDEKIQPEQKVSITDSGTMHLDLLLHEPTYLVQMALVTGIRNKNLSSEIASMNRSKLSLEDKYFQIRKLFIDYCLEQDRRFISLPSNENYYGQVSLIEQLERKEIEKNVLVHVKWFNGDKGFGFVSRVDGKPDAFLSLTVVEEYGKITIHSGAKLHCEIISTSKGYQVSKITHIIESKKNKKSQPVKAKVAFFNKKKGFGFLKPETGNQNIYISQKVLSTIGLDDIEERTWLTVETEMQLKGPAVKKILQ